MKAMGLEFSSISNPAWFTQDPKFAWGFWGAFWRVRCAVCGVRKTMKWWG
jgi:hypothetical protein